MENSGGIQASLAGRYARALFDLASDRGAIDSVEASLVTMSKALAASADLQDLISNPIIARSPAAAAIKAVAKTLALDSLTTDFLAVLADNARLSQLPAIVVTYRAMTAAHRGEVTAEVTTAHPLTASQLDALKVKLKARVGGDVTIDSVINPDILGGMIVKIGSQMIDGSIATKLNTLALAMKG